MRKPALLLILTRSRRVPTMGASCHVWNAAGSNAVAERIGPATPSQPASQAPRQAVCLSVHQSASQSASQSTSEPASHPASHPASQSAQWSVGVRVSQSTRPPTSQPSSQAARQSGTQPVCLPVSQPACLPGLRLVLPFDGEARTAAGCHGRNLPCGALAIGAQLSSSVAVRGASLGTPAPLSRAVHMRIADRVG